LVRRAVLARRTHLIASGTVNGMDWVHATFGKQVEAPSTG